MPLPGTKVIPVGWAAHHRPTVEGTMTGQVAFRKRGGTKGVFDPVTGTQSAVDAVPYFTGPCRVQALAGQAGGVQSTGEQQVTITGYLITVSFDVTDQFAVDDLGVILAVDDNGHPGLVGKTLIVRAVVSGTLAWERDIYATLDLG